MRTTPWWVLGGLGVAGLIYWQRQPVAGAVQSGVEDVQAAVSGWKSVGEGPKWVPALNLVERNNGIPTDLLARIAYQESRFRPDIIDGTKPGGAGELGMMQLMPKYFSTVRDAPVPFIPADTGAQIQQAAELLAGLFARFNDWGLAIAAYNDGAANIDAYLNAARPLPHSTAQYVAQVLTDVPVVGASLPA